VLYGSRLLRASPALLRSSLGRLLPGKRAAPSLLRLLRRGLRRAAMVRRSEAAPLLSVVRPRLGMPGLRRRFGHGDARLWMRWFAVGPGYDRGGRAGPSGSHARACAHRARYETIAGSAAGAPGS
jgi:hypothetical protein